MKKSEQVSMAIGKCFAKSRLNETDIATIKELGASGLLDEGLNENQIREIMLWCQNECQRLWGQSSFKQSDYNSTVDFDNQGLKDFYETYPKSPYGELAHRGFRS